MTGGLESHDKGTVGLVFQKLSWMENKGPCVVGGVASEFPNDLLDLRLALKRAKCLLCMDIDLEFAIADEMLPSQFRAPDILSDVVAQRDDLGQRRLLQQGTAAPQLIRRKVLRRVRWRATPRGRDIRSSNARWPLAPLR